MFRGDNVANNQMTFGKISCLVGELNRSVPGLRILPGLGRNIEVFQTHPDFFYHLHHGVHFIWDDDLPRAKKMCILMACYTLDYIFHTMNGLKNVRN